LLRSEEILNLQMKIYEEYPKIGIHQSGKCDYYYPICTHKSKVLYTIVKFSKCRYWKWTHILHLWHMQIKIVGKAKSETNFSCLCIKIDFSNFQGQHKKNDVWPPLEFIDNEPKFEAEAMLKSRQ
jgi:hypothetical protein